MGRVRHLRPPGSEGAGEGPAARHDALGVGQAKAVRAARLRVAVRGGSRAAPHEGGYVCWPVFEKPFQSPHRKEGNN